MKSFIQRRNLISGLMISLVVIISPLFLLPVFVGGNNGEVYWPTNEWPEVSPEQQGLDSSSISRMLKYIEDSAQTYPIILRSVIIVRNGYLLFEEYFYNFQPLENKTYFNGAKFYHQASTTKSLMALLIGVAIGEGFLDNISQTLYEFFADIWDPSFVVSEQKKEITIEQLLTMNAGFPDSYKSFYPSGSTVYNDCIEWALKSLPLVFTPGESGRWEYSNDGPNLLSGIINNVTGKNASEFAREYLFEPMGITEEEWDWRGDSNGVDFGGYGFSCSPRVQAKLGMLCLNNGSWNNTQLIPSYYVREATSFKSGGYYGPYGYLFYTNDKHEGYHTFGAGGQCIYVIPEYNMVVGFTGDGPEHSDYRTLLDEFILKFSAETGGNIPGSPLLMLMSITIFAIGYQVLTFKKKKKIKNI